MHYYSHILSNGLRIIHLPLDSPVAYCGLAIHAGSRDEKSDEHGLAHFVEHLLFKGTAKRSSWHILNRMEAVGGELNAYTSKEETFVYAVFLETDFGRAVELIADLIIRSQFPAKELDKEREVILDEIRSYKDNPAELIFDDYENLLYSGHPLGHHILGEKKSLLSFGRDDCLSFVQRYYTSAEMVFFSMGRMSAKQVVRLAEKYLSDVPSQAAQRSVTAYTEVMPSRIVKKKKTHQTHIMLGSRAYPISDDRRMTLFLLNNILGGPGMNSRLNVSLREKNGLVYNVESNVTAYTDTGMFAVYFGTDPKRKDKALALVEKELRLLRENKLSGALLSAAKKQAIGQIGISSDNHESLCLGMAKTFLHTNCYESLPEIFGKIDSVTAEQLLEVANEIFAPQNIYSLIYE